MIVGIDISSTRIDLAWVIDGQPHRWHQQLNPKAHLIDRLRAIRVEWPSGPREIDMGEYVISDTAPGHGVTDVAIEMPFGQSRKSVAALMAVCGIVTRQAPPWARVAWPSSHELRAAIGAKNTKNSAHRRLANIAVDRGWGGAFVNGDGSQYDEHEADALIACLGWSAILEAQDDA